MSDVMKRCQQWDILTYPPSHGLSEILTKIEKNLPPGYDLKRFVSEYMEAMEALNAGHLDCFMGA